MKNKLSQIIWGKDNKFNGLIALVIVSLIVLGCNCNKITELTSKGKTTPTNPSNSVFPTNTGTAPTPSTPTFTKADASKKQIPSDAELQEMIKKTLLGFNSAIQTQDFSNFHTEISRLWQKETTPDKLKQTFQSFIDGEADISNISSMNATITSQPQIIKRLGLNMLDVKGEYSTSPIKTTFELQYAPEGKDWKLALIRVYTAIKRK